MFKFIGLRVLGPTGMQSPLLVCALGRCSQSCLCTCQPLGRNFPSNCLSLEVRRHMCSKIGCFQCFQWMFIKTPLCKHIREHQRKSKERLLIAIKVIPESTGYQEGSNQEFMVAVTISHQFMGELDQWLQTDSPKDVTFVWAAGGTTGWPWSKALKVNVTRDRKEDRDNKSAQVVPQETGN